MYSDNKAQLNCTQNIEIKANICNFLEILVNLIDTRVETWYKFLVSWRFYILHKSKIIKMENSYQYFNMYSNKWIIIVVRYLTKNLGTKNYAIIVSFSYPRKIHLINKFLNQLGMNGLYKVKYFRASGKSPWNILHYSTSK